MTDRYAVIGYPVSHSKSPFIHAQFAKQTRQDLHYDAVEVEVDALAEALAHLHAEPYRGLNVTLPHKVEVAKHCEQVSARAQLAGAVNTLLRTDSGWRGDNTDGEGFLRDLKRLGYAVRGARVLVLGAGGATRGILGPLLAEQPALLAVSNRNPWKPEALAEQFKAVGTVLPRTHLAIKGDRYDLIINATSAGHTGQMPRLPGPLLAQGGACYDLSYGSAFEPFAAWAREQGAQRISDGLGMLVEQAAAAFEIWRGVRPDTAPVLAALRS
ncbi:shikimate dehydrogenase [Solimonas aquatica]|uniref:Shikimate dehydrogenase (NADP(+)) n=1 Tax=Solimonas aquatica TaxID=489703 RepID=A0A1H9F5E6_9GAMM|nr:shikimate dehydrogenase [Solimonas aquatica]SEQ33105.1 shikimate dehydrogenase [Solimonas aquatica]